MTLSGSRRKKIIITVSVIAFLFLSFRVYKSVIEGQGMAATSKDARIVVGTVSAVNGDIRNVITISGDVCPNAGVDIYTKASGKIEKVNVDIGDTVGKGQVLAIVEHEELDLKVKEAEAALKVAQADLEKARAGIDRARNEFQRAETLKKNGMISDQEFEKFLDNYRSSSASLSLSEAQANDSRRAQLDITKQDLSNCWIRSPIAGVVTRKNYDMGAMVYTSNAGGSVPLFRVEDLSVVKVRINVPAKYVKVLKEGMPALVSVSSMGADKYTGEVKRISPGLDQQSRSAVCEVEVENRDMKLRSGSFAEIEIDLGTIKNTVIIPRDAVMKREGKEYSFVFSGGKAHMRQLKTGVSDGEMIQVIEGIKSGEEVITSNKASLYDQASIRKGSV